MRRLLFRVVVVVLCLASLLAGLSTPALTDSPTITRRRSSMTSKAMAKQSQVMVDMVFSFGELGFQEVETSKYLTGILEKKASRSSTASRVFRRRGSRRGDRANRLSRWVRTSTAFRKRRRNPASLITIH